MPTSHPSHRCTETGRRRTPRVVGAVVALAAGSAALVGSAQAAEPTTDQLRITFDDTTNGAGGGNGSLVVDESVHGNHGVVRAAYGGSIIAVEGDQAPGDADAGDSAADFPNACRREPCANALVEIADDDTLDPGVADFEWGALVKLGARETADGENVLQKGLWGQVGGQWKLQIDKAAGIPSCVVSGVWPKDGSMLRVVVKASISVADGKWHDVRCRRTVDGVAVVIDGTVRGSMAMPVVDVLSDAPVTIGAKSVKPRDNDQFQGVLDDVFMTLI